MRLTLVRNATLLVETAGRRLLVDPLLSDAGAYPPIAGTANPRPNPLVPLPVSVEAVLEGVDAVLVTHLHNDHFDRVAQATLPRDLPLLCQPADTPHLTALGFADVRPVDEMVRLDGVEVRRTGGRHGLGEVGEALGPVSGFVVTAPGEPVLYVAGDTIWCEEVEAAIAAHRPDAIVVNAGDAAFLEGGPIIMGADDVAATCAAAPGSTVVAVHMEALNHCFLSRSELRARGLPVLVPEDGETIALEAAAGPPA
ncbi:MAG TPA: MBL fold metallo-hydrolase [Miltoncostaeaceae bacterium]|nr:MBL fold metallo-hydrolase [Miltoncostaeaceae bacterium]